MAEKNEGFVWHSHHNVLLSYIYDYDRRVRGIKNKPLNEIPMRRERFQFVKGKLPDVFNEVRFDGFHPHWDAVQGLFNMNKDVVEKLHAEECKGCTWNGKEMIFHKINIKRALSWIKIFLRWRE